MFSPAQGSNQAGVAGRRCIEVKVLAHSVGVGILLVGGGMLNMTTEHQIKQNIFFFLKSIVKEER
jgi:hypothetical protein